MITSADVVLTLFQPILFPTPQQIQGFAADDVFDTDQVKSVEVLMGVDGILSAGFVFVPMMQNIAIQADSDSLSFFETIFTHQYADKTVYPINGSALIPATSRNYNLTNGNLTGYKPTPDVKRVLQPMRFQCTWQSILPAPSGS